MNISEILQKWHRAKEKIQTLEESIDRYKATIAKEMNTRETDTISEGDFSVTRRRTARDTFSKANIPADVWKKYATRCSYDVFQLKKKKD